MRSVEDERPSLARGRMRSGGSRRRLSFCFCLSASRCEAALRTFWFFLKTIRQSGHVALLGCAKRRRFLNRSALRLQWAPYCVARATPPRKSTLRAGGGLEKPKCPTRPRSAAQMCPVAAPPESQRARAAVGNERCYAFAPDGRTEIKPSGLPALVLTKR